MKLPKLLLAMCLLQFIPITKQSHAAGVVVQKSQVEVQAGNPNISYANVEFTTDGKYMVFFEGEDGNDDGKAWHCSVNSKYGTMSPSDCRGFMAFKTNSKARPNVGHDSRGPFYVGANREGKLIIVRPTGAKSGRVTKLSTPASTERKGIYATKNPTSNKVYIVWQLIKNETQRTLQYIDLANPKKIYNIETQDVGTKIPMAPMDVGFFRLVEGTNYITYGALQGDFIQMKMKDLSKPWEAARFVTKEPVNHMDPYGFVDPKGDMYLASGIDAKAKIFTYKYNKKTKIFDKIHEFGVPKGTQLKNPSMSLSVEPFFHAGQVYGVYQMNDQPDTGGGYFRTSFEQPGEIWMYNMLKPSEAQVRISGDDVNFVRAEPEPLSGPNKIFLFYNAYELNNDYSDSEFGLFRTTLLKK